jgi:penicillin amidase
MIATLAFFELRKAVGERAVPKSSDGYERISTAAIERLLTDRPADWFADYDALLLRSLDAGLQTGAQRQGSKVSRWEFGKYQMLAIDHPVGGRLPLIGKYFDIGPVPFGGSPVSVLQYTGRLGPSLRIVNDLGSLDHSLANLVTGESGQRLSGHYKDEWDAYYSRRSLPMQFGKVEAKQVLNVRPR